MSTQGSMNYFEELLERERLRELDKLYFSEAKSKDGTFYSDLFESASGVCGKGGFGFLRHTKSKTEVGKVDI